ncbi:MAG: aspartate aminotransferase family protein [Sulfobacillus benefaciens]|uniref:Aspartate aminotransferase family protein n=1 Tax=Sulfobacillus benefaciens TaxID=453960 RepID=A0A2T2X6Z9_9FIRM|nr:MAG: aspartate aminotransferase family protein [Sulfobacillus benefaciens]
MIDRMLLQERLKIEEARFVEDHPKSRELFHEAQASLLDGVPMNWMVKWPGGFPVFVESGDGAYFTDVDGKQYLDFCLGDTGSMTGHAPTAVVNAVIERVQHGTTFMLPTQDAIWVGEELQRRFGLPFWQVALTATDANRFALRLARHITGRPRVLVFNWCYHGSVDESFITLSDATPKSRQGNIGPAIDPTLTSRVVEFNDVDGLTRELAHGDVACVLTEPVLTNIGIVHPEPGFHEALRDITRKTGTLLIIDETHTMCAGPGGYTQAHGLRPDFLTVGKAIAGGIPAAVYGFSQEVASRIRAAMSLEDADTGGIGGTLAGNALSLAAMRATLGNVLTPEFYENAIPLAEQFVIGVQNVINRYNLPWNVTRLGNRTEYWFRKTPARNGSEAAMAQDSLLDRYMHLASLNRGILMTPFHNMALISSATPADAIDYHTAAFDEIVQAIVR